MNQLRRSKYISFKNVRPHKRHSRLTARQISQSGRQQLKYSNGADENAISHATGYADPQEFENVPKDARAYTYAGCGGILYNHFTANLQENLPVAEF